jgi:hypothetical protein
MRVGFYGSKSAAVLVLLVSGFAAVPFSASVCRRLGGPHLVAFCAYSLPNILLCWSQLCLKRAVLLDAHVASALCISTCMLYPFDSGFVLLAGLLVMGGRQRFVLPSGTAVCGA